MARDSRMYAYECPVAGCGWRGLPFSERDPRVLTVRIREWDSHFTLTHKPMPRKATVRL